MAINYVSQLNWNGSCRNSCCMIYAASLKLKKFVAIRTDTTAGHIVEQL